MVPKMTYAVGSRDCERFRHRPILRTVRHGQAVFQLCSAWPGVWQHWLCCVVEVASNTHAIVKESRMSRSLSGNLRVVLLTTAQKLCLV